MGHVHVCVNMYYHARRVWELDTKHANTGDKSQAVEIGFVDVTRYRVVFVAVNSIVNQRTKKVLA